MLGRGVDELDRKKVVWSNFQCNLEYPDDIADIQARYDVWLADQSAAANAVVSNLHIR